MIQHLFGIWTVIVALTVSVVAAYYSIVGLTAIFAAAVIPVVIMGTVLEVAKITTAVWLHTFWNDAQLLMKTYLTLATVVLMLITSMGIFGFLSKAHIEQSASGTELIARIERTEQEIKRYQHTIERANIAIDSLDDRVTTQDTSIQDRIANQEQLIQGIEKRSQRDILTQTAIIEQERNILTPHLTELNRINKKQLRLQAVIEINDVRALQAIIGAKTDGVYGTQTIRRAAEYEAALDTQRAAILAELERLQRTDSAVIQQARADIQQLQSAATREIQRAQDAINTFRQQLITVTSVDNTDKIAKQEAIIIQSNADIDVSLTSKFALQAELRQIEIEVGPVKYIAELIYGDANQELLDEAVRGVIIILVIVFDPLAIILILAGISILIKSKETIDNAEEKPHNTNNSIPESDIKVNIDGESSDNVDSGFTGNNVTKHNTGEPGVVTVAGRTIQIQTPNKDL